ncbi:hypothetical protein SAMN05216480_11512 [Pustulibacterium marinum]|uniref:Hydrolase n=1 Tax=Pustulibacterium marinum TaxID=1224947 RepID=A0A1I7ICY9_9FLAO|nr:hydrolase [Pustulibacterium marinum]SFU70805.1 hypothetical protein SAMN05216480_11512 [Pustulibacterium marinum]
MKKQIFMYLFVFAILALIFQYVNAKKAYEDTGRRIDNLAKENTKLKDSLKHMLIELSDYEYFSIENDTQALEYFYDYDIDNIQKYVSDKLIATNTKEGNPLIPYVGIDGTMRINKIRVVNHRWVLCDFSDGKNWGQLVIEYFINDDYSVEFNTIAHVMYPQNR